MVSSTQPRTQRVNRIITPYHKRGKLVSAHLTPELRSEYSKRSVPIRKGDTVTIVRGEHKKKTGKVSKVLRDELKINVEGITRSKTDGTKVFVPIDPSNVVITELELSDERRVKSLRRGKKTKAPKKSDKNVEVKK